MSFGKKLRAEGIIGRSAALAKVFQQIAFIAPLDISVLLTGPTGSGKTAIARLIHDNSPRASRPFIAINCAALPEMLVESELFGALPGSHSMAARKVQGKVEAAQGGTLFFDEIGELSLAAQGKLLQLLQSGEYYPLGACRPVTSNARVIAATNIDLRAAVAKKAVREDLFFRLQVLPVRVPSLAQRREDVPDLAAHFCERACRTHGLSRVELSTGALQSVESAEWPGNVRELAHFMEAAVIRAAADGVLRIEREHVFPDEGGTGDSDSGDRPSGEWSKGERRPTLQGATRSFQASFVLSVVEETGWNITEAAARLDVARSHVYNLIKTFGLERRRRGAMGPLNDNDGCNGLATTPATPQHDLGGVTLLRSS